MAGLDAGFHKIARQLVSRCKTPEYRNENRDNPWKQCATLGDLRMRPAVSNIALTQ